LLEGSNISPTQFSKSFHKILKKWKAKSERGGRMFVKFPRMIKVKEKISGSFASYKGGEIFCRIRSYISTLKKNNIAVLQGLRDVLAGNAYVPIGVGC